MKKGQNVKRRNGSVRGKYLRIPKGEKNFFSGGGLASMVEPQGFLPQPPGL
jgi:hypothetical protein